MRVLIVLLMLTAHCAVSAQSLSLFDIDGSLFSRISAQFYAFDAQWQQARPSLNEITVREDGFSRTVLSVTCPSGTPPSAVSSVLVMDVSGSMSNGKGTQPNIELAITAAKVWIAGLPLGTSECAIVSFDDANYLNQDFTTSRAKLVTAADSLKANGGTDYDVGLLTPSAGGLVIAARGKYKKVVVFLTDGESSKQPNVGAIVAEAQRLNCAVYCVTLGMQCPQSLRDISTQTGGMWFENLTTNENVNTVYETILMDAQDGTPCTVEWLSAFACAEPGRSVVLGWNGVTSERTYTSSPGAITDIVVTPQPLYIRSKRVAVRFDTTITITNGQAATTVSTISSSHAAFDVNPKTFALSPGQSMQLTVSYTPVDSGYTYASFTIESDICRTTFYASGSFPGKRPTQKTFKVVAPNGGELFAAGSDTIITWTGIPLTDHVRLEYSNDAGMTWTVVANDVTGGSYRWRVPGVASDKYLIRATQLPLDSIPLTEASVVLVGHSGLVIDVSWDVQGDRVLTASSDFTAKIWDAKTGYDIHTLREHTSGLSKARFNPEGTKVATSGNDTRLLIWDAFSGSMLRSLIGHESSVRTIGWSPDGTQLVSGSWDGDCRVWDPVTGAYTWPFGGKAGVWTAMHWHPDGNAFAISGLDAFGSDAIKIRNTKPGGIRSDRSGCGGTINKIEWGDSGTALLVASNNGVACIWRKWGFGDQPVSLIGHTGNVMDATWSPDGNKVATASADGTVKIWDGKFGQLLQSWDHASPVQNIGWSSRGVWIATSSNDTAMVWNALTGKLIEKLVGHRGLIRELEWSADGLRLATSSNDLTARIWEVDAGLQRDVSDATFSVVAPQPLAQDIDMGKVLLGRAKDSVVIAVVRNTGVLSFRVDDIQVGGVDASDFSIVSGAPPFTVDPGSARAVEFRFRPTSVGQKAATLSIRTQSETLERIIIGEGVLPVLEFVSTIIDFGLVDVGRRKDTLRATTIKNISNDALVVHASRHAGPNAIDFSTLAGAGSLTLQPGETSVVDLRFAPTSVGRTSGRLLLDYEGVGSPAMVTLFGEGRLSGPMISATALAIAPIVCPSEAQDTIVVYNLGIGNLVISDVAIGGPDAGDFALDNVVVPITIPQDSSTRINIRFRPGQVGMKRADVVFSSNSFVDSVFAIPLSAQKDEVSFATSAETIDLGLLCPEQLVTTSVSISNTGTVPTHIHADATAVQLTSASLPLALSETVKLGISVTVGTEGMIDEIVVLTDSVCGVRKEVRIIGAIERPVITLRNLDIVGVVGGVTITRQLVISNPSRHTITIPTAPPFDPFIVATGAFPITIPAQDSVTIDISYLATDTISRSVSLILDFVAATPGNAGTCAGAATAAISGRGVTSYARIAIGRIEGYPGDIIHVPIVIDEAVNLNTAGATAIGVQLRMNATLLDPIDATPRGVIEGSERVIDIELPATGIAGAILATLPFKVMLGNDTVTPIAQLNAQAIGANVFIESVDGEFHLLGTCLVGGARLLNPIGTARIVGLTPNPADNSVEIVIETIENGRTSIVVVDEVGRDVALVFDGELTRGSRMFKVDTSRLGSGNYFVNMRTPTIGQTAILRILK
ncbi:MAG: choice-of-anchor D domain-containing protein [bacterium]|nr:choice-of-anchor D domain-containing protein [bacterium]